MLAGHPAARRRGLSGRALAVLPQTPVARADAVSVAVLHPSSADCDSSHPLVDASGVSRGAFACCALRHSTWRAPPEAGRFRPLLLYLAEGHSPERPAVSTASWHSWRAVCASSMRRLIDLGADEVFDREVVGTGDEVLVTTFRVTTLRVIRVRLAGSARPPTTHTWPSTRPMVRSSSSEVRGPVEPTADGRDASTTRQRQRRCPSPVTASGTSRVGTPCGGASLKQAQTVLGHASAVITPRTCAHLSPGMQ